jgi:hypothetical protein
VLAQTYVPLLVQVSGYSNFFYPALIDPTSKDPNFGDVGSSAELFLVGNACAGAQAASDGTSLECSPFTPSGELVRDILKTTVVFSQ